MFLRPWLHSQAANNELRKASLDKDRDIVGAFALQQSHYEHPSTHEDLPMHVLVRSSFTTDPLTRNPSLHAALFLRTKYDGDIGPPDYPTDIALIIPASTGSLKLDLAVEHVLEAVTRSLRSQDRLAIITCDDTPSVVLSLSPTSKVDIASMKNVLRVLSSDTTPETADMHPETHDQERRNTIFTQAFRAATDLLISQSRVSTLENEFNKQRNRYKRLIVLDWNAAPTAYYPARTQTKNIVARMAASDCVVWKNVAVLGHDFDSTYTHTRTPHTRSMETKLYKVISRAAMTHGIGTTVIGVGAAYVGELGAELCRLPHCNCICVQKPVNLDEVLFRELPYLIRPVAVDVHVRVTSQRFHVREVLGLGLRHAGKYVPPQPRRTLDQAPMHFYLTSVFASPHVRGRSVRGGVVLLQLEDVREHVPAFLRVSCRAFTLARHPINSSHEVEVSVESLEAKNFSWILIEDHFGSHRSDQQNRPALNTDEHCNELFDGDDIMKAILVLRCSLASLVLSRTEHFLRNQLPAYLAIDSTLNPNTPIRCSPQKLHPYATSKATVEFTNNSAHTSTLCTRASAEGLRPLAHAHPKGRQCLKPVCECVHQCLSKVCRIGIPMPNISIGPSLQMAGECTEAVLSSLQYLEQVCNRGVNSLGGDPEVQELRELLKAIANSAVNIQNRLTPEGAVSLPPMLCMCYFAPFRFHARSCSKCVGVQTEEDAADADTSTATDTSIHTLHAGTLDTMPVALSVSAPMPAAAPGPAPVVPVPVPVPAARA